MLFNRLRKFSLQLIILGSFFVVLLAGMAIAGTVVPSKVDDILEHDLVDRGQSFLKAVSALAAPSLHDGRKETAQAILARTHFETLGSELTAAAFYLPRKDDASQPDFSQAFGEEFSSVNDEGHLLLDRALLLLRNRNAPRPLAVDGHAVLIETAMLATNEVGTNPERVVGYAVAVLNPGGDHDRVSRFKHRP